MTPTFSEDIAFSLLGDWEGVNKTLVPMKNLYHKSSINQLKGPRKTFRTIKEYKSGSTQGLMWLLQTSNHWIYFISADADRGSYADALANLISRIGHEWVITSTKNYGM